MYVLIAALNLGILQIDVSDTVYWCKDVDLSWNDFRSKGSSSWIGALSATQIHVETLKSGDHYNFNIYAVFLCKESWVNRKSASLLNHEQIHFNITELETRRIRAYLSNMIVDDNNYEEVIREMRRMIDIESDMNKKFDDETKHGFIQSKQMEWKKNIDDQLDGLERYRINCKN